MKKFMISLIIGIAVTIAVSNHFKSIETALASGVVRLHILANSNTPEDQNLKLKVRDAVLKKHSSMFVSENNIKYAKRDIIKNIDNIKKTVEEEISKNGYKYPVNVSFGESEFPTKIYNNITLPQGTYDALKIEIGTAKGQNWWCVMFPPLCFVDGGVENISNDSVDILKSSLSDEEFKLISSQKNIPVKIEFKLYEIWQKSKSKIKTVLKNK